MIAIKSIIIKDNYSLIEAMMNELQKSEQEMNSMSAEWKSIKANYMGHLISCQEENDGTCLVAYKNNEEVEVIHSSKIKELLEQKQISENTIVYNTSLANSSDLLHWEQSLKNTWLGKYL